jgi:hypothetical protein
VSCRRTCTTARSVTPSILAAMRLKFCFFAVCGALAVRGAGPAPPGNLGPDAGPRGFFERSPVGRVTRRIHSGERPPRTGVSVARSGLLRGSSRAASASASEPRERAPEGTARGPTRPVSSISVSPASARRCSATPLSESAPKRSRRRCSSRPRFVDSGEKQQAPLQRGRVHGFRAIGTDYFSSFLRFVSPGRGASV